MNIEVGVQVKANWSWKEFYRLSNLWHGMFGDFFLAVYHQQPGKIQKANINLKHFLLVSVTGNSPLIYEQERRHSKNMVGKVGKDALHY